MKISEITNGNYVMVNNKLTKVEDVKPEDKCFWPLSKTITTSWEDMLGKFNLDKEWHKRVWENLSIRGTVTNAMLELQHVIHATPGYIPGTEIENDLPKTKMVEVPVPSMCEKCIFYRANDLIYECAMGFFTKENSFSLRTIYENCKLFGGAK